MSRASMTMSTSTPVLAMYALRYAAPMSILAAFFPSLAASPLTNSTEAGVAVGDEMLSYSVLSWRSPPPTSLALHLMNTLLGVYFSFTNMLDLIILERWSGVRSRMWIGRNTPSLSICVSSWTTAALVSSGWSFIACCNGYSVDGRLRP